MNKPPVVTILSGILITAGVLLLSGDGLLGSRFGQIFLFPAMILLAAAGPGPNIGNPEHPVHEFTPVRLVAILAGLGLSALMYSGLIYLVLKEIASRRQSHRE